MARCPRPRSLELPLQWAEACWEASTLGCSRTRTCWCHMGQGPGFCVLKPRSPPPLIPSGKPGRNYASRGRLLDSLSPQRRVQPSPPGPHVEGPGGTPIAQVRGSHPAPPPPSPAIRLPNTQSEHNYFISFKTAGLWPRPQWPGFHYGFACAKEPHATLGCHQRDVGKNMSSCRGHVGSCVCNLSPGHVAIFIKKSNQTKTKETTRKQREAESAW